MSSLEPKAEGMYGLNLNSTALNLGYCMCFAIYASAVCSDKDRAPLFRTAPLQKLINFSGTIRIVKSLQEVQGVSKTCLTLRAVKDQKHAIAETRGPHITFFAKYSKMEVK